jgi:four helix bundle protein
MERKYDLEDRLVSFAIETLDYCEGLPYNIIINSLIRQLVRSATAPALMYGEVQGAESRADFIHKMKLILKELRETRICFRILSAKSPTPGDKSIALLKECNELIGIFSAGIKTAKSKIK